MLTVASNPSRRGPNSVNRSSTSHPIAEGNNDVMHSSGSGYNCVKPSRVLTVDHSARCTFYL